MVDRDSAAPDQPFALSPKEAAARLSIDVSTLYRHYGAAMRSKKIRVFRIGRSVRIVWESLLAYIERESHE